MGGGTTRSAQPSASDYTIDLCGEFKEYSQWRMPSGWKTGLNLDFLVYMPIPDRGVPPVGLDFWQAMWEDLDATKKALNRPIKVLAMCLGGHGRTGTIITALALARGGIIPKKADPLKWIRTHYCEKAVESGKQVVYLEDTFGVTIKEPLYKAAPVVPNTKAVVPYNGGSNIVEAAKTYKDTPADIVMGGHNYKKYWDAHKVEKLEFLNRYPSTSWTPAELAWIKALFAVEPELVEKHCPRAFKPKEA